MEIVYTYHARRRMEQRKVTPEQVDKGAMKTDCDPHADAMHIQFKEGEPDDTLEIGDSIFVDVDEGVPP